MSPIISGILGSIIAASISGWWLKKYPLKIDGQDQDHLVSKYRLNLYLANLLLLAPLIALFALIKTGIIANNDWRFGLLLLGSAFGLPLWALLLPPFRNRGNFREALLAMSIKQHTPSGLLLFIFVSGNIFAAIGLFYVLE